MRICDWSSDVCSSDLGNHIQSTETEWPDDMPPVVFEDRSMIVTRFRSGLRAAGFVEFGRAESPSDARKWARLRAHVQALGLPFRLPGEHRSEEQTTELQSLMRLSYAVFCLTKQNTVAA